MKKPFYFQGPILNENDSFQIKKNILLKPKRLYSNRKKFMIYIVYKVEKSIHLYLYFHYSSQHKKMFRKYFISPNCYF